MGIEDKRYKNKSIRLSDKVWMKFKQTRKKSGLSWNLFIKELLK